MVTFCRVKARLDALCLCSESSRLFILWHTNIIFRVAGIPFVFSSIGILSRLCTSATNLDNRHIDAYILNRRKAPPVDGCLN